MYASRLNITTPDPSTVEVAPHRYLWNAPYDAERARLSEPGEGRIRDFLATAPYQKGDVVYVVCGEGYAKAYISEVALDYDRYGDRREKYRVHRLNVDGKRFSKRWYYAHPGYIQRGYYRAGLAPEMPREY